MKSILIVVGKTTDKNFIASIADYCSRIHHYMPFELLVIPELKNTKSLSKNQQKEREGDLIFKSLQPTDTVVLLDEHGIEWDSMAFASWLQKKQQLTRRLVFVVGGPYGFSPEDDF